MKIAVDAMGGDYAPSVVVEGSVQAARELDIPVILVGDRERIEFELAKYDTKGLPLSIKHASEVVGMDESAVQAIRGKRDSSLRVCFELVRDGEAEAFVSAGNSGAAMAAGILILKKIKGIDRPAIAVSVPTMKDPVVILDVGGNVDCKPLHLVQFAIMGDVYAKYVLKTDNPRIGLLSNGEEEGKGNELTRSVNAILKNSSLNYIGYVEGKDIFKGSVDVVVTDGFVGNVVLKLTEGVVEATSKMLKAEIKSSWLATIGYLFARIAFKKFKKKMDYAEHGGAPLLGIGGSGVISHGGSTAKAIKNAILRASEYVEGRVNDHIIEELFENRDLENIAGYVNGGKDSEAKA